MNRDRFQTLAEAYGGELHRWPAAEQAAAAAFAATDPAWSRACLAEASALDALLDAASGPAVRGALADRIAAGAPLPGRGRRPRVWWLPAGLGAGLAAACAVGLLVGVQLGDRATQNQAVSTAVADSEASLDFGGDA